jgi:hypothetical protein
VKNGAKKSNPASSKCSEPRASSHEQLIRRQGSAFDIGQEQWVELEGFLHGDPASMQSLIARSDEELMYALRSAKEETLDGAHGLSRHGPDVTDAKLERRVIQGYAADGKISPASPSTKFKSYQDFFETRQLALKEIADGEGMQRVTVDLSSPPGLNGNTGTTRFEIVLEPSGITNLTEGFEGVGTKVTQSIPKPDGSGFASVKVYPGTIRVGPGLNRTKTTIEWLGGRRTVVQHIPWARDFDHALGRYTTPAKIL